MFTREQVKEQFLKTLSALSEEARLAKIFSCKLETIRALFQEIETIDEVLVLLPTVANKKKFQAYLGYTGILNGLSDQFRADVNKRIRLLCQHMIYWREAEVFEMLANMHAAVDLIPLFTYLPASFHEKFIQLLIHNNKNGVPIRSVQQAEYLQFMKLLSPQIRNRTLIFELLDESILSDIKNRLMNVDIEHWPRWWEKVISPEGDSAILSTLILSAMADIYIAKRQKDILKKITNSIFGGPSKDEKIAAANALKAYILCGCQYFDHLLFPFVEKKCFAKQDDLSVVYNLVLTYGQSYLDKLAKESGIDGRELASDWVFVDSDPATSSVGESVNVLTDTVLLVTIDDVADDKSQNNRLQFSN
ncbi:MAG TPA: hypothetical protein VHZ76_08760 [Gammaproteobacteria bacterium]|jgi:hypothetical protein|nr:hypothetical protein [Gammaproteobacteria bacterium]